MTKIPNLPALALSALLALAWALPAVADTPPPEWDQLDAAQRDVLVAPLRERWDGYRDARQ